MLFTYLAYGGRIPHLPWPLLSGQQHQQKIHLSIRANLVTYRYDVWYLAMSDADCYMAAMYGYVWCMIIKWWRNICNALSFLPSSPGSNLCSIDVSLEKEGLSLPLLPLLITYAIWLRQDFWHVRPYNKNCILYVFGARGWAVIDKKGKGRWRPPSKLRKPSGLSS